MNERIGYVRKTLLVMGIIIVISAVLIVALFTYHPLSFCILMLSGAIIYFVIKKHNELKKTEEKE